MENITVIGIGKLGLGFALMLEESGYNVLGVDIFPDYVEKINSKSLQSQEPEYNELLKKSTHFIATTSLESGLNFSDKIFIVVQTPNSGGERFYDHSILSNLLSRINKCKVSNKHIIIGCTVMPTYIDQIGKYLISDCTNCTLSYNPEFVAQGDIMRGFRTPDIILVGTESEELKQFMTTMYTKTCTTTPKFCFLKPIEAEVVKIALNSFITTKISFANMVSDFCDSIGADKHAVLDSIGSDSRVGNKYFRPGYSFGGPCFPRDTRAFKQVIDQYAIESDLLVATSKYNQFHTTFQSLQLMKQYENESHVVISGVCYKENSTIPIIEESAKLRIARELAINGKTVVIRDTQEIVNEVKKEYGGLFEYEIEG